MPIPERKVVLQIIDSLHRGGAQKVVLEICRALPEFQHIVCYWEEEKDLEVEFLSEGVELIKLPFKGMRTLFTAMKFVNKLKTHRTIHFVHSHMFVPNLLARFIKDNSNRTLCTYHGECFEQSRKGFVMRVLERMTLEKSDEIIAVSDHVRRYLKRQLWTNAPVHVIHNFGNYSGIQYQFKPGDTLRLVATSNNQLYKNYALLLNVFEKLKQSPVTLDIYGSGMDSLIREAYQRGIVNVKFKGSVTNVTEILPQYDAYIIASHSGEGFSLAVLEAMNVGLPVIASDIPQFTEALDSSGLFFRNGDVMDLQRVIETLILNPSILNIKSNEVLGRSHLFSKDKFTEKIRQLYNNLAK